MHLYQCKNPDCKRIYPGQENPEFENGYCSRNCRTRCDPDFAIQDAKSQQVLLEAFKKQGEDDAERKSEHPG